MTISSPTTSIYFLRGNAKSNRESSEREKSGCHPCKNGHLTPKLCIKGEMDDDKPSNHLEWSETTWLVLNILRNDPKLCQRISR